MTRLLVASVLTLALVGVSTTASAQSAYQPFPYTGTGVFGPGGFREAYPNIGAPSVSHGSTGESQPYVNIGGVYLGGPSTTTYVPSGNDHVFVNIGGVAVGSGSTNYGTYGTYPAYSPYPDGNGGLFGPGGFRQAYPETGWKPLTYPPPAFVGPADLQL